MKTQSELHDVRPSGPATLSAVHGEARLAVRTRDRASSRTTHCAPCGLEFTPRMMAFHTSWGHLVLKCQLCQSPVLRLGLRRNCDARAQYCSAFCLAKAESRGLCRVCSKDPDNSFRQRVCRTCRHLSRSTVLEIREVNGALSAIERARFLPRHYERRDLEGLSSWGR